MKSFRTDYFLPSVAEKFLNEEAAKFVRDFKSLAKEADESLAKHKALEFEIERLLRAVVSQDIYVLCAKKLENENMELEFQVKKHISSECNNIKLVIRNDKSEAVCAMYKQFLITANHDVSMLNYVNGMNSRGIQICLWCINSGCSKHMIGNLKLLINFFWKFLGTVCFGNDHVAAILGYGALQWGNILITRVYFVEGLGHNLFSVGQFYDSDLEVAFRRNTCFVRNLEGVDLLKGNRTTNLYTINLYEMAHASPICLMARATSTKSWLWHQRLSHLNFDTINDLAKNDLVIGLPKFKYHKEHLCPSCEQGKSKKASHPPKLVPNSKQSLHLLHMHLCGPMRTESINGKRYVLVIVDDYSRYTWVHFLRSKDESPEEIKTFLKKITVLLQAPVIINDREDIGKLGAKGDIGFFIGYSANSCAYRMILSLVLQTLVNQSPRGIFINQSNYVLEILKKYGMETCDPVGTSIEIKDKLDLDKNGTLVDATKYRSMIGALMYLTSSRPDIVHATYLCARYKAKPTEKHVKETPLSYFRWNSILRQKAGGLVLEKARLYSAVNRGSRICVSIRLLCPSPLDADTVNRLWLSFQQDSYLL
ncbi:retrovirus-related pol polyprotein from transposon TNT 1-94 [Tanacetum coccineum]